MHVMSYLSVVLVVATPEVLCHDQPRVTRKQSRPSHGSCCALHRQRTSQAQPSHCSAWLRGGESAAAAEHEEEQARRREPPPPRMYRSLTGSTAGRYLLAAGMLGLECLKVYTPSLAATAVGSVMSTGRWAVGQGDSVRGGRPSVKGAGKLYDKYLSKKGASGAKRGEDFSQIDWRAAPVSKYAGVSEAFMSRHGIGGFGKAVDAVAEEGGGVMVAEDEDEEGFFQPQPAVKRSGINISFEPAVRWKPPKTKGPTRTNVVGRSKVVADGDDSEFWTDEEDEEEDEDEGMGSSGESRGGLRPGVNSRLKSSKAGSGGTQRSGLGKKLDGGDSFDTDDEGGEVSDGSDPLSGFDLDGIESDVEIDFDVDLDLDFESSGSEEEAQAQAETGGGAAWESSGMSESEDSWEHEGGTTSGSSQRTGRLGGQAEEKNEESWAWDEPTEIKLKPAVKRRTDIRLDGLHSGGSKGVTEGKRRHGGSGSRSSVVHSMFGDEEEQDVGRSLKSLKSRAKAKARDRDGGKGKGKGKGTGKGKGKGKSKEEALSRLKTKAKTGPRTSSLSQKLPQVKKRLNE